MGEVNLRDAAVTGRGIATTDQIFAATQSETDASEAFKSDTVAEFIATVFQNPPGAITPNQRTALRTLLQVQSVFNGANLVTPYKLGNIYRASAAGVIPDKPGNAEGVATAAGITGAPAGWQLARPEATAALPNVYDCHVYGYQINAVFGWQFGTPNRTDRYIAPGGGSFDLHDDVADEIPSLAASDRFLVSDENVAGDPNRFVTLARLQAALTGAAIIRNRLNLTASEATGLLVDVAVAGAVLTLTQNNGEETEFSVAGYAALAGATFTGEASGVVPVNPRNFATKEYVDAGDAGTAPPSPQAEEIYFGSAAAADAAAAALTAVADLMMQDATVAGHDITLGPAALDDFFVILVPADHDLLTLLNTGTQADARGAYTRTEGRMLGDPAVAYVAYVLGPLNAGVSITYHLTLTE